MLSPSNPFLAHYDDVIQTMPFMEEKKPVQWLTDLVAVAAHYPEGIKQSVLELQTVNWKALEKIPSAVWTYWENWVFIISAIIRIIFIWIIAAFGIYKNTFRFRPCLSARL